MFINKSDRFISLNDYNDCFRNYLREISKFSLINEDEERKLLLSYTKFKDNKSFEKLVCSNLRFVVTIAKKYKDANNKLPDLVNVGNIGLIDAIRKFDVNYENKLITFAVDHIKARITQYKENYGNIIPSTHQEYNKIRKLNDIKRKFMLEKNRCPSVDEIQEILGKDNVPYDENITTSGYIISIEDAVINVNDFNTTTKDTIEDNSFGWADKMVIDKDMSLSDKLNKILLPLNKREKAVVLMHLGIGEEYYFPMNLTDIAVILNVSSQRASGIYGKAISKLKNKYKTKKEIFELI